MATMIRSEARPASALVHERNKYLTIFNNLRSPAAVFDRQGCIDTVNPAWAALFGEAAAPARSTGRHMRADGPAGCLAPLIAQFISGEAHDVTVERAIETASGTRHLAVHISRLPDADGCFSGCTVLLEDLTPEKAAAAAACDSERLQGALALAGAVCHDLNQPLMAISGYAELLMMNCPTDAPHYAKLKKMAAQVEKVGSITRKLMNVTRYETKAYLDAQIMDIEKASEGG